MGSERVVGRAWSHLGADGPIVFGWVFASHQIGAAIVASGAGVIRDLQGIYQLAWYLAGGLCAVAAVLSLRIRQPPPRPAPAQ